MPANFTIQVDLTAPQVTWGTPTGTTAGELLRVPFTIDEDAIVSAELELPDGRRLTLTIRDGWLEGELPIDTVDGLARLVAVARDDVANEATYELAIAVRGALVEPPSTPRPPLGRPSGIAGRERRFISTRSAARARDADEVLRRRTRVRTRARAVGSATTSAVVRVRDDLHTADAFQVFAQTGTRSASRAAPGDASLHRGVGDSITQALLLDLL